MRATEQRSSRDRGLTPAAGGTTPGAQDEARDSHFVQSFQRGLDVIRAFDAEHPTMTLSEVARATGLARAAARRFLLTLVELGYLRVEDRRFRLTPRVLELGQAYLAGLSLPDLALPYMRDFVAEKRESASLAVLDGDEIVYVAHVTASRIMSVAVGVGTRDPAVTTSLGRVLLAGQPDEWLEDYVANVELVRLDRAHDHIARRARGGVGADPSPGLGDGRPGARGGGVRAGRPDPRCGG